MKIIVLAALAAISFGSAASAGYVNGYFRKNGTYVQPHFRSAPDGYCFNNLSGC